MIYDHTDNIMFVSRSAHIKTKATQIPPDEYNEGWTEEVHYHKNGVVCMRGDWVLWYELAQDNEVYRIGFCEIYLDSITG